MEKFGLKLKNQDNYIKNFSLKKFGTETFKKDSKSNNYIKDRFRFSESEAIDNKININYEDNSLIKANNKIINIITNCIEKIKKENKEKDNINPIKTYEFENKINSKEQKRKNKKQVTFQDEPNKNDNYHFIKKFSKKSQKLKSLNKNKINFIPEQNNFFYRIRTTSRLPKEKEKEIVYNISSSLISLYKPNKKYNMANDNNKSNYWQSRRYSCKGSKLKKKNSKNSKDGHFHSSLSTDSPKLKKSTKSKKFHTFILVNSNKTKTKINNKRNSCKSYKYISEFLLDNKSDSIPSCFKLGKDLTKSGNRLEGKIKNINKNSFDILKWTKDYKNRENLTEGEYVHIEEDLRQSLIGYEKTKLEEEMANIDRTEITDLIRSLPTMKINNNTIINNKNISTSMDYSNIESNPKENIKFNKERFRLLQHTGYVYDSLDDEEVEDAIDINYYYISPDSIYIYIFDSIIAIFSFYCLYYLPYYLAHDSFIKSSNLNIKLFLFFIIDIFYILDLIISFFRAYFNYDEILIKNIINISFHYIKSWFFLDLLTAIPFYSIIFFIEKKKSNIEYSNNVNSFHYLGIKIFKIHYLLILNKLVKIFKCFSDNNRALTKIFQILYKNDKIEEKSGIFFIIFILLTASNIGTCLFIFLGRNSYPSWMNEVKFDYNSFSSLYICSLYYLFATITTVGYGDIYGRTIPEILFQMILLMVGTCTYSYLISSVSNYIKKINEKSLIFENKLDILNDIKIANPHMEEYLYDKILRFLRYKKNTEKSKQKLIINSLPYSLKNLLIIEMYKPIIKNFIIFKGLENSNCIVQLVSAFKPIYAIKNDILIQEGDFIEEVIFVKTGIISLEIGIDLNNPKESIVQYLNGNNEREKPVIHSNIGLFNYSYSSINSTSTFLQNHKTSVKNEKKNIRYLKVLDIRKNEHFGETLMFLNERSPLTAKIKSKKAELFFLTKEEVIKIFNAFPNIWNRINKKSIYNMKQIKKTVVKVLLKFCSMFGININDDVGKKTQKCSLLNLNKSSNSLRRKSLNKKEEKEKKKYGNNQDIKIEQNKELVNNINKNNNLNLSIIKNINFLSEEKNSNNLEKEFKSKSKKYDNKDIIENKDNSFFSKSIDLDKTNNEKIVLDSKDIFFNFDINPKSNELLQNRNINNYKKNICQNNNNNVYKDFSNIKRKNNSLSCSIENKNNLDNHNFNYKKCNYENFELDKSILREDNINLNSSIETIKKSMNKNIYTLTDSESIKEEKELNHKNEKFFINDEIYENENFNLKCEFKDELLKRKNIINSNLNDNIKLEALSRKILEKTWLANLDKGKAIYLEKLLNKPQDNNSLKEKKNHSKNESIFHSSSSCESWLLNMSYICSFEIKAAYENINEITCNKYIKNNKLRNKTKEFLLKECSIKNEDNKKVSESEISPYFNCFKSLIYDKKNRIKNKRESEKINKTDILSTNLEKNKKFNSRGSMPNFKFNSSNNIKLLKYFEKNQKKDISQKTMSNNILPNLKKGKNIRLSMKNNNKEKLNKTFRLPDEKEMSFYDKYNLLNLNIEEKFSKRRKKHDSELEEIKQIIKQGAQNLNQPSLYYQKLFLNQIQKRKDYNQTFLPTKNNKNINSNLNIRRISTSREAFDIKKKLVSSVKRNKKKSSINITSKLKNI